MFDEIVIAIGYNSGKQKRYFDVELMIAHIEETFKNHTSISVIVYNELTATLAQKHGAHFLLRGLRNTTDFEYENSISQVNRHLNDELETVFLITTPKYAAIKTSIEVK